MSPEGEPALRVGLEVHVPLAGASKLHCPCPVDPDAEPNTTICPTCTGQPGAKPQGVNRGALERAVAVGLLLGCSIVERAVMQRKHYTYPDLPNNYQRTSTPIGNDGNFEGIGIIEAHLEEDPGAYDPDAFVVDLNRCGAPLSEIVTAPDLRSADDVVRFLRTLRVALDINGLVRPGAELKADVNVSVGDGPRVEVKNVTGARNAARAVEFEAQRQLRLVEDGQAVTFETRHFDEASGMTRPSREKETVSEYRYAPDPDLPPLPVSQIGAEVDAPDDVPARLREAEKVFDADRDEVLAVAEDPRLFTALDELAGAADPPHVFDFVNRVVRGELHYRKRPYGPPLTVEGLSRVLEARQDGRLTRRAATTVVREWLDGGDLDQVLEAHAGVVAGDDLDDIAATVIEENPKAVQDYRDGAEGAIDFLLGRIMQRTKGRADPQQARSALEARLDG